MGYTAKWGPRGFVCTTYKVLPIMGFSTSKAVKTETQSDSSDTAQTNIKGTEPYSIKLSTVCLRAAGVDPRKQIEDWEAQLGNAHPLYVGEKRFGPKKLYLKSVDTSDYLFTNSGKILSVTLDLNFEEYVEPAAKTTVKATVNSSAGRTEQKKSALSATASSVDRLSLKQSKAVVKQ